MMKEGNKDLGAKFDSGKPQIARGVLGYFPDAIGMVARCSEFGAEKYCWGDWKYVEDGKVRYLNAIARHLTAASSNVNNIDEESGLLHLAHAAWNALAVLQLIASEKRRIEREEEKEELQQNDALKVCNEVYNAYDDNGYKTFMSYNKS